MKPPELSTREKELDRITKLLIRRDLELTEANNRLQELDRVKSEFISTAAHQLRTPLSGVKWVLRSLLDNDAGKLNKEQKDLLLKGYDTNERMIRLVNDFLAAARIEQGRFVYNKRKVNLRELIESIMHNFSGTIEGKNLTLSYNLPVRSQVFVLADPEKISIVLDNLIDNAVKYTPKGGKIVIGAREETDKVIICVKNSGMGIPQEQQDRIFSRFFRGANVIKSGEQGTGLGLYISRNIVKAHDGELGFSSKEEEGAEFFFTLPLLNPIIKKEKEIINK